MTSSEEFFWQFNQINNFEAKDHIEASFGGEGRMSLSAFLWSKSLGVKKKVNWDSNKRKRFMTRLAFRSEFLLLISSMPLRLFFFIFSIFFRGGDSDCLIERRECLFCVCGWQTAMVVHAIGPKWVLNRVIKRTQRQMMTENDLKIAEDSFNVNKWRLAQEGKGWKCWQSVIVITSTWKGWTF